MAKYLDSNGLLYFWQKIKNTFALASAIPTKTSDLTNDSNFAADASYVHTDNNYTTTEKNKLSGIASGAEVNVQADWDVTDSTSDAYIKNKPTIPSEVVVDSALSSTSENPVQNKVINTALGDKVDKETGKGLSTNDYTTAEKTKLDGIATGAEVNVQSDWSVSNSSSDAYIKNKPTLAAVATSGLYSDLGGTPYLGAAAEKGVNNSISSDSTNLPTVTAVKNYVSSVVTGATAFQGTAPTSFAPTGYKAGYYWVVQTAGTYVGETCEVGDMIFAVADYSSAYSASDFEVIQNNIDTIANADIDTIVAS